MAITAGFKQQCPSCEALIPIRDPNLIGRKIDCPKCKYRFVVKSPEFENPRKQKKSDGSQKMAVGVTLCLLSIIPLVGTYFLIASAKEAALGIPVSHSEPTNSEKTVTNVSPEKTRAGDTSAQTKESTKGFWDNPWTITVIGGTLSTVFAAIILKMILSHNRA